MRDVTKLALDARWPAAMFRGTIVLWWAYGYMGCVRITLCFGRIIDNIECLNHKTTEHREWTSVKKK